MLRSVPSLGLIAQVFDCAELYPVASFFFLTFYFHKERGGGGKMLFGNLMHTCINMHILKEVQFVEMQKGREERCYC